MSGASCSSYGSGVGSEGGLSGAIRPSGAAGDDDTFEEPHSLQLGVFGVLYTVSKEKQLTSLKFVIFKLFLDFLQLWLLLVNPAYGWSIDAENTLWKVVSFIQLNAFLSDRGYLFFLVLLYVFVGLLCVNVALSVWVARSFSNNRFDHVWPIQFLRWFGLIFYQVLDIATLTLLLVTLDCNYFGVPEERRFRNQQFPDIMCWSMPHIIHVGVSVVSIVVFYVMASAMVMSEMELNPLTRNLMAVAHTGVEGWGFMIKTVVTVASVMLPSLKWLSLVYFAFFSALLYIYVKWVPFTYSTLNYVRCASYACVLYCSTLLLIMAYGPSATTPPEAVDKLQHGLTWAMWGGMAPAAVVGAVACHLRLRHFRIKVVEAFRDADPTTKSKFVYKFTDAREVEIAARCCRVWQDEDTPSRDAVALSKLVVKAGMVQLPTEPWMVILYSSFLIDVQGSYQSGYAQLQACKKHNLDILARFAIFSREQENTQKASGANGGGDNAVDLVSYVEFQRNHRLVVRAHREALIAMRSFWGLLLRNSVNFNTLSRALHRIEVTVKAAERAYRSVLQHHKNSSRILRLYGRFIETVKFDPWTAAKWYGEADKLEEEAEHAKEAMQLVGTGDMLSGGMGPAQALAARGQGDMEGVAIICISALDKIQVANPEAHALLGYSKNELKGRDLGVIMPPPFCDRHAAYVRNHVVTGQGSVLDRTNEFVALSKTGQVIPVKVTVSKVSGLNEDLVFLGVLEPMSFPSDEAHVWVLSNGAVMAADTRFCDWLGYEQGELVGQQLEQYAWDRND